MQRYILNNQNKTFYKEDLHHIKNVMRNKTGDRVEVCLNSSCFLVSLNIDNEVSYNIIEQLDVKKTLNITLIQGSLKGSKIESVIKYATIFGAKNIIITEFERSISKLKNMDNKLIRYSAIAKEAAELSKRESIPNVVMIEKLKDINFNDFDLCILADEEELNTKIADLDFSKINLNSKVAIIIGPEGGISKNDRNYLINNNSYKVTLGNYIYPAEIAHISPLIELSLKSF